MTILNFQIVSLTIIHHLCQKHVMLLFSVSAVGIRSVPLKLSVLAELSREHFSLFLKHAYAYLDNHRMDYSDFSLF